MVEIDLETSNFVKRYHTHWHLSDLPLILGVGQVRYEFLFENSKVLPPNWKKFNGFTMRWSPEGDERRQG